MKPGEAMQRIESHRLTPNVPKEKKKY